MIAAVLFAGLWQGAIFTAAAAIIVRCVSRYDAATRYVVWYAALLATAVVPPATLYLHLPQQFLAAIRPAEPAASFSYWLVPVDTAATHAGQLPVASYLTLIWAAAVCVKLLGLAVSYARIRSIRSDAVAIDNGVFISDSLAIPIAAGLRRPVVIVPAELRDSLPPHELEQIVEHERAHIRRGDIAANLLQRSIEALLFFNPWVYVAARCIVKEREAACDDLAVQQSRSPADYAAALAHSAKLIGRRGEPLLAPGAFGSPHAVVVRIQRLLARRSPLQTKLNYYAIGGTIMLFAILALAFQSVSPALAYAPAPAAHTPAAVPALIAAGKMCTTPNADVTISNPATPRFPEGETFHGLVRGSARVTIGPDGDVVNAKIAKSTGNAALDQSVLKAAKQSTYTPKIANCKPVEGTYLFFVQFSGNPQPLPTTH